MHNKCWKTRAVPQIASGKITGFVVYSLFYPTKSGKGHSLGVDPIDFGVMLSYVNDIIN